MPEDDEYKNSPESNENRSEEPQSDLNDKGFEQYVNEDGSKDAILDKDYFQDSESIPQESFVAKPKSQDLNKNVNSDTNSASDQIKDTSGEQISDTNNYYHFGSDSYSEDTSGLNEDVGESGRDYSSSQESSPQVLSQTPITHSTSNSQNVSQQSSEKSSNKSHINEQSTSASALNPTEQESSSSSPLNQESKSSSSLNQESKSSSSLNQESKSSSPLNQESKSSSPLNQGSKSSSPLNQESKSSSPLNQESKSSSPLNQESKSSSPLKSESASSGQINSEGKNSSPIKPESASSSPIKPKSKSSDSVLKDQGTVPQVLRRSASMSNFGNKGKKGNIDQDQKLKRSKSLILKSKDKDKNSKKNNTSMANALNVASSISGLVKVDTKKNTAENIIDNAIKELKSAGVRMVKSKLKNFLLDKCVKNGISKSLAKKTINKVLNSTKVGAIVAAPGQIWNTMGNLYTGNVGDTFKDAAMSLASGDPVPIIATAFVIGIVILFGISLMCTSFSNESQTQNYYNYVGIGKNFEGEESDDDEGNRFNATAMINFNNTFNNLNDYFYKYSDDSNNMLSNSLKKSDQSIDLMKQLAKKLVQTRQFKYNIFDDYFIKYFFDEVTEKELKDKVKSDIKNSGMLFTETYIGKFIQTNKLYNSFKKDLDDYKSKINQIKTNTEKAEGEDENTFKNKVINEFKLQNPNVDSIYLTCYKLLVDSVDSLKIVENIDMNLENRWENTKELTSLLYFIKNINDIDENRELNIEDSDLENILKNLEDELINLNISVVGKTLSGQGLNFDYTYGSKHKKTSLYLEKEFLNTCDVKYQKIIDDIGTREDISGVNFSDYKNIMDNTENWNLIYNLQIFEGLINNYNSTYIPNDLLLGNKQSNTNNQEDESEEEVYDFDNCLYKVYSIIQEKIAENFGKTQYNGEEAYERKNSNIFYRIPEIDVTEIDKAFYFNTEMVMNTEVTPNKSFSAIKRDEIVQKLEDLIPFLINYQNIVKEVKEKNKNEMSDVEKRISNENANDDIVDENNKYIYEDSKVDDLFAFDDLRTIEIDNEKYYVFDDISELSEIRLNLSSKDFLTWLEDDSSFYNDYIPEALIFEEDDELEDMMDIDDFAKELENADENFVEEIFKDAAQQHEKLFYDSDYDLTDEYIVFKYLLFGGVQNFEPVLNQVWENNIADIFGNFATGKTNLTNDDIPFTNYYNDYIALSIPSGKDIYAICSGEVVEKTDNSITVKNPGQLFDEGYSFYVEYENLSPGVNVGDSILRYSVPTKDYFEQDENGNIKNSTVIGKAKAENLKIRCYIDDKSKLINPRLIIQDDDGLPVEPYIPPSSPTPKLYPSPSYKIYTLPPKIETPTVAPYIAPPDPLHKNLLFIFGTIIYYAGLLYAIWAIIKFALGLHDYESANYQAIWQFIAASVLIFAALLLKFLAK